MSWILLCFMHLLCRLKYAKEVSVHGHVQDNIVNQHHISKLMMVHALDQKGNQYLSLTPQFIGQLIVVCTCMYVYIDCTLNCGWL